MEYENKALFIVGIPYANISIIMVFDNSTTTTTIDETFVQKKILCYVFTLSIHMHTQSIVLLVLEMKSYGCHQQ
ncbi:hypothetical protein DERF_001467 [Dermatophagoides farinae]|uniref:Uncharacterized protein n=1 Tax=Dermatophagoides farinae TaxID=6954 RepID=A0A922LD02_DERFA|nr:hypothetical protein DERF_001467 [Dermatophagoides farinae]